MALRRVTTCRIQPKNYLAFLLVGFIKLQVRVKVRARVCVNLIISIKNGEFLDFVQ
jgi:hypothetical protein